MISTYEECCLKFIPKLNICILLYILSPNPNVNHLFLYVKALISAVASNQLELIVNEIQTQYSRQLTAQQLLAQVSQLGLLNSITPQDLSALQSIASGAALNGVVHQMSPVAAAAAALHSPITPAVTTPQQQRPPPGLSPAQQLAAIVGGSVGSSGSSVGVQNFLSALETSTLSGGGTSSTIGEVSGASANVCTNVSAVAVEVGHTASNHGVSCTLNWHITVSSLEEKFRPSFSIKIASAKYN